MTERRALTMTHKICSVTDCDKPVLAKGICSPHYHRLRKNGSFDRRSDKNFLQYGREVAALYEQGLNCREIGAGIGVSHEAVRRWLQRQNIQRRTARDYDLRNEDLFWEHVYPEPNTGCWLWGGAVTPLGYGLAHFHGEQEYASRLSWFIHHGKWPGTLFVCHHCDNPPCVNPEHLFLGTHGDNMADMAKKQRCAKKLTVTDARKIKQLLETRISRKKIAEQFGVSRAAIDKIAWGRMWAYV